MINCIASTYTPKKRKISLCERSAVSLETDLESVCSITAIFRLSGLKCLVHMP